MPSDLVIRRVEGARARKRFAHLPWRLYRGDAHWAPPLAGAQAKVLAGRTPFFERAEMSLFLAERGGEALGRIAAIHNRAHNEHYRDTTGFFGFFECDAWDVEAAAGLFDAAEGWLAARGLTTLRGPVSPSMSAECGLLIEGFDRPPMPLMAYNPPSYPALFESLGLRKCKDLYAYLVDAHKLCPGTSAGDRLERLACAIQRRNPEITIRSIDMRNYSRDILLFMRIFDEARKHNWGYVPSSQKEILYSTTRLKAVVDPDLIFLAEVAGEPAGAMLAIPNLNRALSAVKGRLFPLGFLRFFRELERVNEARVLGVAALPTYRAKGITALLFCEQVRRCLASGYRWVEASWVLEDNQMSNESIIGALVPTRYKTYRLYEKPITQAGE
ncbi:MAG: N-acetyltransferase [Planctomycetota bacterium]|nr:N-acetyltransferase [Planctomycetota bacterium]